MKSVIEFKNVVKDYYLFDKDYKILKWLLTNSGNDKKKHVLKNISFTVEKGEIVGIIGKNGAGKSTILNLIQSTTYPSSGEVIVNGKVGSFINLGAGFFKEYTGRENVYYKALLMGINKEVVDTYIDDIIEFIDIDDYFDMPIKTYSSGMNARLGFAISVFTDPDIILLDEVFAVGDKDFRKKSSQKMEALLKSGKTVILTSHSDGQIKKFCTRVIYLKDGEIVFDGDAQEGLRLYSSQ